MKRLRQELASLAAYLAFFALLLLGDRLQPATLGIVGSALVLSLLFAVMMWAAFNVVHHAESLAELLGEPYGTLILTLSVIGIEVALIAAVMLTGADSPTVARDTMFSVLMIALNGLVGFSLLLGGLRHNTQVYNLQGANAFLSVLLPLAILGLILPRFTTSAPGGEHSALYTIFIIILSIVLYGAFLAIQTMTLSDIFRQPQTTADGSHKPDNAALSHHGPLYPPAYHAVALFLAILPIVLLAKKLALYIDYGILATGAPVALGGFLVAAIILTPEALSSVNAARANQLQRSVNISLGSALATIGLTIPAVLGIGWMTGARVELGLEMTEIVMLLVTLVVSIVTFVSPRTNILQGVVHLALFAAYVMLIFDV